MSEEFVGGRDKGWIESIIEVPAGSHNKYEYDHERGVIVLDRVLYSAVHYPTDYGFVPGTLSADGDPIDVLLLMDEPLYPGVYVKVRPVGALIMADEKGDDEKILAAPVKDPRYDQVTKLADVAKHRQLEIAQFFRTYKELQGITTEVRDWQDVDAAWRLIEEARQRYLAQAH